MANTALALPHSEHWKPASALKVLHEESKYSRLSLSALEELFPGGLKRGTIFEVHGSRSSGRTSLCLHILAQGTSEGEICAVIDLYDSFHPASAASTGVRLDQFVWVRCQGNAEHAIRAADLLLHAGGFGVIMLDLCEAPSRVLNRIPLSYWYRFLRAVEHTPTILLLATDEPQAKSCTVNSLKLQPQAFHWTGAGPFSLLRGMETHVIPRKISVVQRRPLSIFAAA